MTEDQSRDYCYQNLYADAYDAAKGMVIHGGYTWREIALIIIQ